MTKKRNPFFLFIVSLIPGAGEMYLGFFRHGISVMTIFFLLFMFAAVFSSPLFALTPVVWFYSFFHANNLNSLADEEFYSIEDNYFLHVDQLFLNNAALLRRHYRLVAGVLIFFGASILWNSFNRVIQYIMFDFLNLPAPISQLVTRITNDLPDSVVAIAIIAAGVYMIKNKKDSLNRGGGM